MEELTVLNQVSFWLFALLMVGSALGVVFHRSIVYSALFLLVAFLSIAGFFVLLNAPFIAAAQVLVYGVGLTIVLIFGIMLTGDKPFVDPVGQERPKRYWQIPAVIALAFMGFLTWALLYPNYQLNAINGLFTPRMDPLTAQMPLLGLEAIIADGGITHIGQLLFSQYLIPFELASVLLLLAMIGAIILSKRKLPEEEGEVAIEMSDEPLDGVSKSGVLNDDGSKALSSDLGRAATCDVSVEEAEKETLGVH